MSSRAGPRVPRNFKSYAAGIIVNDDGVVMPPPLFKDGFEELD